MSKSLGCFAFETLCTSLSPTLVPIPFSTFLQLNEESLDVFPDKSPLFVTWNKRGKLRGCIGTFSSLPIEAGIIRFTKSSAFNDPRFPPIKKSELNQLDVSITLLDKFTPITDCEDWIVGNHGLNLSFTYDGKHYSGTFLPNVAEEQYWDRITTLYYLLKKCDFDQVPKEKVRAFYDEGISQGWMELERYDGFKTAMTFEQFDNVRTLVTCS